MKGVTCTAARSKAVLCVSKVGVEYSFESYVKDAAEYVVDDVEEGDGAVIGEVASGAFCEDGLRVLGGVRMGVCLW